MHPSSRFRVAWDVIACIFVVWISVSLPFRIAFSREWTLGMAVADFLIDIVRRLCDDAWPPRDRRVTAAWPPRDRRLAATWPPRDRFVIAS